MPWMRAALARADKSGIGLRDQESLRNYPDFEFPELWQDLPNVAILVEPRGQVPRIPIPNSVPVTHHPYDPDWKSASKIVSRMSLSAPWTTSRINLR
jgi:hypothetical protein